MFFTYFTILIPFFNNPVVVICQTAAPCAIAFAAPPVAAATPEDTPTLTQFKSSKHVEETLPQFHNCCAILSVVPAAAPELTALTTPTTPSLVNGMAAPAPLNGTNAEPPTPKTYGSPLTITVKSRLFVYALLEQLRSLHLPFFECLNRRYMVERALGNMVVVDLHIAHQRRLQLGR